MAVTLGLGLGIDDGDIFGGWGTGFDGRKGLSKGSSSFNGSGFCITAGFGSSDGGPDLAVNRE